MSQYSAPATFLLVIALSTAGMAASGPGAVLRSVPRREVTLRARGMGVHALVRSMGTQAGVSLAVVPHLADRRVTLLARDQPVAAVMGWLEELWSLPRFPARWRREGDGYRLWQDPAAELELQRRIEADRRLLAGGIGRLVDLAGRGGPPPAATGHPVVDAGLHAPNWNNGGRAQMRLLGELPPAAQASVLRGETVWIPFQGLSRETQAGVVEGFGGYRYANSDLAEAGMRHSALGLQLQLGMEPEPQWNMVLLTQNPAERGPVMHGLRLAPFGVSSAGEDAGEAEGVPGGETATPLPAALRAALAGGQDWKELADFQEFLAEHAGLSIVSDYYPDRPAPRRSDLARAATLEALLGESVRAAGYRWRRPAAPVFFRNRRWFLDDLDQPPATLEDRLLALWERREPIPLLDLAETSQLSPRKLARLDRKIPGMKELGQYRRLLGWYRALSPALREAAGRPAGLRVTDSGRRALAALFPPGEGPDPLLSAFTDRPGLRIAVRQQPDEGRTVTLIDLMRTGGSWVRCRYIPPTGPGG